MKTATIFLVILLWCSKLPAQTMEQTVADHLQTLSGSDDFNFLQPLLKGKRLVLIGEATHVDGSSCEARVKMIRYLNDSLGFTVVGLEPLDFISGMILNDSIGQGDKHDIRKCLGNRNLLNNQQAEPLWQMIMSREVEFTGIDDPINANFFVLLRNAGIGKTVDLARLEKIVCAQFSDSLPAADLQFAIQTISSIENQLNITINKQDSFSLSVLLQGIENVKTIVAEHVDFLRQEIIGGEKLRDIQMARNIIWYLNKYPAKKMVVWCASSHAIKNPWHMLGRIYNNEAVLFTLMGQYLYNYFKDELYAIAITSSTGFIPNYKNTLMFEMTDEPLVSSGSLEFELYKKNVAYGYINLSYFRENEKYADTPFQSYIVSKRNYLGKWQHIFDGIYYIRKQYPIKK